MDVLIINYGMGNLRSVSNAFLALGCEVRISDSPRDLRDAGRIVLPGVGAFGDGMTNLERGGWIEELERAVLHGGRPFLGICLGMQLLASTGTEHGVRPGMNWIPGVVERLREREETRVPHIGWNDVTFDGASRLYSGIEDPGTFYFVHSYVLVPEDPGVVTGWCRHGTRFAASIEKENIFAVQYHPEKSQKTGLAVLNNFLKIRG